MWMLFGEEPTLLLACAVLSNLCRFSFTETEVKVRNFKEDKRLFKKKIMQEYLIFFVLI
jgi:hypothetical protein